MHHYTTAQEEGEAMETAVPADKRKAVISVVQARAATVEGGTRYRWEDEVFSCSSEAALRQLLAMREVCFIRTCRRIATRRGIILAKVLIWTDEHPISREALLVAIALKAQLYGNAVDVAALNMAFRYVSTETLQWLIGMRKPRPFLRHLRRLIAGQVIISARLAHPCARVTHLPTTPLGALCNLVCLEGAALLDAIERTRSQEANPASQAC